MRQAGALAAQPSPPGAQLKRLEHPEGSIPRRFAGGATGAGRQPCPKAPWGPAASGFAFDLKPFRPHVTVVRKVSRPGPVSSMHSVVWRFSELALVASRTLPEGALYSVVESFPLCSGHKDSK